MVTLTLHRALIALGGHARSPPSPPPVRRRDKVANPRRRARDRHIICEGGCLAGLVLIPGRHGPARHMAATHAPGQMRGIARLLSARPPPHTPLRGLEDEAQVGAEVDGGL